MAVQNWYNWKLWERKSDRKHKYVQTWNVLNQLSCIVYYSKEPSWSCSYGSWIYNYLWNQCLSPLMLWVRISIRARCITICDQVYQWLATGRWFFPGPLVSSTNKNWPPRYNWNIVESGIKHHQTNKHKLIMVKITVLGIHTMYFTRYTKFNINYSLEDCAVNWMQSLF